jgi:hypothetical protein
MARKKVLMITNSELGQATVFLATSYAILENYRDVEIHIAAYAKLAPAVESLRADLLSPSVDGCVDEPGWIPPLEFHPLPGKTFEDILIKPHDMESGWLNLTKTKPTVWNLPGFFRRLVRQLAFPWDAEDFVLTFNALFEIIEKLDPDIAVVDGLFPQGLTATRYIRDSRRMGANFNWKNMPIVLLSPNSLREFVGHVTPPWGTVFTWSVLGSGLPAPLPKRLIPLNIYLLIRLLIAFKSDKDTPAKIRSIQKLTQKGESLQVTVLWTVVDNPDAVDKIVVGCSPDVEFKQIKLDRAPIEYRSKIVPCGPILRPSAAVSEADPDTWYWLTQKPIVYICLGSHCLLTTKEVLELAKSLRYILDNNQSFNVLWKLKLENPGEKSTPFDAQALVPGLNKILGEEISKDRIRIVDWVLCQPTSLYETGKVLCSVNHGGANSYYESLG